MSKTRAKIRLWPCDYLHVFSVVYALNDRIVYCRSNADEPPNSTTSSHQSYSSCYRPIRAVYRGKVAGQQPSLMLAKMLPRDAFSVCGRRAADFSLYSSRSAQSNPAAVIFRPASVYLLSCRASAAIGGGTL